MEQDATFELKNFFYYFHFSKDFFPNCTSRHVESLLYSEVSQAPDLTPGKEFINKDTLHDNIYIR